MSKQRGPLLGDCLGNGGRARPVFSVQTDWTSGYSTTLPAPFRTTGRVRLVEVWHRCPLYKCVAIRLTQAKARQATKREETESDAARALREQLDQCLQRLSAAEDRAAERVRYMPETKYTVKPLSYWYQPTVLQYTVWSAGWHVMRRA